MLLDQHGGIDVDALRQRREDDEHSSNRRTEAVLCNDGDTKHGNDSDDVSRRRTAARQHGRQRTPSKERRCSTTTFLGETRMATTRENDGRDREGHNHDGQPPSSRRHRS